MARVIYYQSAFNSQKEKLNILAEVLKISKSGGPEMYNRPLSLYELLSELNKIYALCWQSKAVCMMATWISFLTNYEKQKQRRQAVGPWLVAQWRFPIDNNHGSEGERRRGRGGRGARRRKSFQEDFHKEVEEDRASGQLRGQTVQDRGGSGKVGGGGISLRSTQSRQPKLAGGSTNVWNPKTWQQKMIWIMSVPSI